MHVLHCLHCAIHLLSVHAEAPVALVLYNAGPLNVSWAKSNPNVQAILLSYFPAQVCFILYLYHMLIYCVCHCVGDLTCKIPLLTMQSVNVALSMQLPLLLCAAAMQTAGDALVAVLTGRYNPAGRLPNTWPASLSDVPPIINYTMSQRTYRYSTHQPLYPFGYGL